MKPITGVSGLFYAACMAAFIATWWGSRPNRPFFRLTLDSTAWTSLFGGLGLSAVLYGLAHMLQLEALSGIPYLLIGFVAFWTFSVLNLASGMSGILLLLGAFFLTCSTTDPTTLQTPALCALFGIGIGKALRPASHWEELALPAAWLIGQIWIAVAAQQNLMDQALLTIFISVTLLLRAVQSLSILPEKPVVLRPLFVVITSGLAAWLAVQTLVLKPSLLNYVWLFTGGSLLSFLLSLQTDADTDNTTSSHTVIQGAIHLVLIGIAALVASRLFGTLGWLILGVGMFSNRQARSAVWVAVLFFLARTLLQVFLYQYNPNVTGINITHPYASAALYEGFITMLLFPALVQPMLGTSTNNNNTAVSRSLAWIGLTFAAILTGGLANYFLHAEATGSLLVSLTVAGLGVSLLNNMEQPQARPYAMLFNMLILNSALLGHELLDLGNEADKTQKLTVLTVALVIFLALFLFSQKRLSRSKSVQVS